MVDPLVQEIIPFLVYWREDSSDGNDYLLWRLWHHFGQDVEKYQKAGPLLDQLIESQRRARACVIALLALQKLGAPVGRVVGRDGLRAIAKEAWKRRFLFNQGQMSQ